MSKESTYLPIVLPFRPCIHSASLQAVSKMGSNHYGLSWHHQKPWKDLEIMLLRSRGFREFISSWTLQSMGNPPWCFKTSAFLLCSTIQGAELTTWHFLQTNARNLHAEFHWAGTSIFTKLGFKLFSVIRVFSSYKGTPPWKASMHSLSLHMKEVQAPAPPSTSAQQFLDTFEGSFREMCSQWMSRSYEPGWIAHFQGRKADFPNFPKDKEIMIIISEFSLWIDLTMSL